MQDVLIRSYEPADKESVLELLRLNTPLYFAAEEEKDLVYFLEHEIEHYFVVEHDGKVLGSGGFNFAGDPSHAVISWDILHPAFHGKGLGSMLLAYRIKQIREIEGVKSISVRTTQLVYKFYEKGGFRLEETKKDYWAKGFDLYRMLYTE